MASPAIGAAAAWLNSPDWLFRQHGHDLYIQYRLTSV
jgi:hypothetical protein